MQSSHLPEDIRPGRNDSGEVVLVVVNPDLVTARHDGLPLGFVTLLHGGFVVRSTVAEDPDAGFVVEVRLDIEALDSLLCGVGESKAVLVEMI
jgi:hypothetical protein